MAETHTGQGAENQREPELSHRRDIYLNLLQSQLREQQGKRGQKERELEDGEEGCEALTSEYGVAVAHMNSQGL